MNKPLTVDEMIQLLINFKNKYGADAGNYELETQFYVKDRPTFKDGIIYDIDWEDGPYCTVYCEET